MITRSFLALCYFRIILYGQKYEAYPKKSILSKLVMRGVFGAIAGLVWFSAIKLIPLSEATVL
jgi:drug/metabolite transporter (DMT)-like permease